MMSKFDEFKCMHEPSYKIANFLKMLVKTFILVKGLECSICVVISVSTLSRIERSWVLTWKRQYIKLIISQNRGRNSIIGFIKLISGKNHMESVRIESSKVLHYFSGVWLGVDLKPGIKKIGLGVCSKFVTHSRLTSQHNIWGGPNWPFHKFEDLPSNNEQYHMSSQNYEHMATCHYEANVAILGQFESGNDLTLNNYMFHILREGVHLEPALLTCILPFNYYFKSITCSECGSNTQPWNLQFKALPTELKNPHQRGLREKNQV